MNDSWGQWFRNNSDKLLLLIGFIVLLVLGKYSDKDGVHWYREIANTWGGALLGLITGGAVGYKVAMAQTNAPKDDSKKATVPVETKTTMTIEDQK